MNCEAIWRKNIIFGVLENQLGESVWPEGMGGDTESDKDEIKT